MERPPLVADELADVLAEFVEVAVHTYLFVREVYPAAVFERRKKYDVPVRMSRHPELNEYIAQVLRNARPWMVDGTLTSIVLQLADSTGTPVERCSFQFDHLLATTDGAAAAHARQAHAELEAEFRDTLLKLSMCDATLPPAHKDVTFKMLAVVAMPDEDRPSQANARPPDGWMLSRDDPAEALPASSDAASRMQVRRFDAAGLGVRIEVHVS